MTNTMDHSTLDVSTVDVVVLGGGAAGLIAAVEAAEEGASVLVLESEAQVGGSTRLSGGYVAMCETDLQPASRAQLLEDLNEAHADDAREGLSQVYVDEAPGLYVRLKELGLHFNKVTQWAHMSEAWGHELPISDVGGGQQIIDKLAIAARERGVSIVTSARARRLVRDDKGAIVAVNVDVDGGSQVVAVKRGVVLATGGFTRNRSLIKNFGRPGTEKIFPITGQGSRGDGLEMGMALGAGTSYIGPGVAPTGPAEPTTGIGCLPNYAGGILLGKEGRRFCDESSSYLDISWAALGRPDPLILHIFDQSILDDYMSTMFGQVLSGWKIYSADTIEGVLSAAAADCGIDVAESVASVRRYNESVKAGRDDEFGRTNRVGISGELVTIDKPPYYAVATVAGTTHFNGGLTVDEQMRVLDVFGEPIPRLFAAGEVTGGFHGAGYLSATHVGSALIFGRIAGVQAAMEEPLAGVGR